MPAGQDRAFRLFSVIQDQQSRELSQGHLERRAKKLRVGQEELRLPRVTAMDACQALARPAQLEAGRHLPASDATKFAVLRVERPRRLFARQVE